MKLLESVREEIAWMHSSRIAFSPVLITACPFFQLPAIHGFGFPLLSGGMDEQAGKGSLIKHGLSIVQALMLQWLGYRLELFGLQISPWNFRGIFLQLFKG